MPPEYVDCRFYKASVTLSRTKSYDDESVMPHAFLFTVISQLHKRHLAMKTVLTEASQIVWCPSMSMDFKRMYSRQNGRE